MIRVVTALTICLSMCGCSGVTPDTQDLTLVVVGAAGDGPWYDGLRDELAAGGAPRPVQTVRWGAPLPFSMLNLQSKPIHDAAEAKLARIVSAWRAEHPEGRLTLVGHSAGCGVILGGLARVDGARASAVVLLAPSVSPGYDLSAALARVEGTMHVFHSTRDDLFLRWRTNTFGTYDNVRTAAAGNVGFRFQHPRLAQHAYDVNWRRLGNDGTHDGTLAARFVRDVICPLVAPAAVAGGSRRSSVANLE